MENGQLSPASQVMFNDLMGYHRERLLDFERMQAARRRKGMDGKYDLTRLLYAQRDDVRPKDSAPHEVECSDRIAKEIGEPPKAGFHYVPVTRDLSTSVASAGGYLVGTETAPGDVFVGALLATLRAKRLGMRVIPMQGNAVFPRVGGTISTGWLATEGAQLTESQFAFVQAAATPKSVGGYCEISDMWLKQGGPAAQNFVLTELGRAVSSDIDNKIINGSGASGQPTGIINTAGIGSVTGTALAWAGVLDIVKAVEDANAVVNPESLGWAVTPSVARLLRARERATSNGFMIENNQMAGHPVDATNSVPADSAVFGDWSNLVLLQWNTLQIANDPYGANSALFMRGLMGVRALWTCDVVVLRPASFCKSTAIT